MAVNYYDILGVSKNASKDEIIKAFRAKAKKIHPDINKAPDATERFQELNDAYETLRDDKKRRMYDLTGSNAYEQQSQKYAQQQAYGFQNMNQGFDFDEIVRQARSQADSFSSFFKSEPEEETFHHFNFSPHVEQKIVVNFDTVINGSEKELTYKIIKPCSTCEGQSYIDSPENVTNCSSCGGVGVKQYGVSVFRIQMACDVCHGKGKTIKNYCPTCAGKGLKEETEKTKIKIPRGVNDNTVLQFQGHGNYVNLKQRGSLFILVKIKPHKIFKRIGNDLEVRVPVKYYDAILGTKLLVPTLTKPIQITIPKNTTDNKMFRLENRGLPILNQHKKFGNLRIIISVVYNDKPSRVEKSMLEKIRKQDDRSFYTNWLQDIKK